MPTPKEVFVNVNDYYNLINKSNNKIREEKVTNLITKDGVTISVRHNIYDIKIVKEQFVDLQYFPNLYEENFEPKVVLDIGGYIGDLSLYCASVYGSKVHCYEPTPQNYQMIQKNLKLNQHLNIKVFNKGISGHNETIKLNVQDISGEIHASSNKTYNSNTNTIEIPCISLLDAIENMKEPVIDLLKIDCEGQEFKILKECNVNDLSKRVKYLVFEYHKFVEDYQNKLNNVLINLEKDFKIVKKTKKLCFLKSKI